MLKLTDVRLTGCSMKYSTGEWTKSGLALICYFAELTVCSDAASSIIRSRWFCNKSPLRIGCSYQYFDYPTIARASNYYHSPGVKLLYPVLLKQKPRGIGLGCVEVSSYDSRV